MATSPKSFWSSTSGVVTGVAGTLTAVLGLASVASTAGWIGGNDDPNTPTTATTTAAETAASTTADRTTGTSARRVTTSTAEEAATPEFEVAPSLVNFEGLATRTAAVEVRNTGTSELNVDGALVQGQDAARFAVRDGPCTTVLEPGDSCAIEVSYQPEGLNPARASMVVEVEDAPDRKVELTGKPLL